MILAPLPLGSNREWSWTLCAFVVSVISLGWVLQSIINPGRVHRFPPLPVTVLFLSVCTWAWVQTWNVVPLNWQHPLWNMGAEALGLPLSGSVSLSAEDSVTAVMRLLCYGLVFFLSFQFGRQRGLALSAFKWLAFAGVCYAIYGLGIFWGDNPSLLWFHDESFRGDVRSTFVNRNSFATYLGLSLLCAIAVFYQQVMGKRLAAYTLPRDRQSQIEQFVLQVWKPLAAILLMTSALILTHSRGGFLSTLSGGLVLVLLLNHRQRIKSNRSKVVLGGAVLVSIVAFVLTSEVLLKRIDRLTVDSESRMQVYQLTTDAITDNPVLGFGYGTFTDSFRLYRDDKLGAHFDKTHNTYLENIFELGWPVAGALFLCIIWITVLCLIGARVRGKDWVFPATGVAASVLVGIHSLFDFSLQMPAIAITYACLLGTACAQSYSSRLSV